MTNDPSKLTSYASYNGPDKIFVGNDNLLEISHIGNLSLNVGHEKLVLDNVLVVPEIKKNLVSVSQLTSEKPYVFEFNDNGFVIRDRCTKAVIAQGRKRGGLYALDTMDKTALFSIRFRSATDEVWHQRLGHPQHRVVELLKNNKLIVSTSKNKSICTSCQMAKVCGLPFILSNEFYFEPFRVIHCDLWGPAHVTSFQRYQYYVIFVDEFTRYTWYFPLKYKFDFL